jgi:AcrR family transcriptional regulator
MAYQVMFLRAVPGYEPSEAAMAIATRAFDGLAAVVHRAMGAGLIEERDPALTAQVIWAGIHGWVSLELCGIGFVEDEDAGAEMMCAAILEGLRPHPHPTPS